MPHCWVRTWCLFWSRVSFSSGLNVRGWPWTLDPPARLLLLYDFISGDVLAVRKILAWEHAVSGNCGIPLMSPRWQSFCCHWVLLRNFSSHKLSSCFLQEGSWHWLNCYSCSDSQTDPRTVCSQMIPLNVNPKTENFSKEQIKPVIGKMASESLSLGRHDVLLLVSFSRWWIACIC